MRTIVLVDGEHHPPVTREAVAAVRAAGHDVVGAAFLGGREKLRGEPILDDLELVTGSSLTVALRAAMDRWRPEAIVDLSDAPVLDAGDRMLLASIALNAGVAYLGRGFVFDAPAWTERSSRHTIAVIGSGKRTGKTAVCAALARHLALAGSEPLIIAMGRGGPAEPVVTHGRAVPPSVASLLALAAAGEHASTDAYEDAVIARCTTVGARRGGAGLNGDPFVHTVHAAMRVAENESHDVLLLEGSGTAIPPAATDATLFVVGSGATPASLTAGLGDLRIDRAHAIVLTGVDAPGADPEGLATWLVARRATLGRSPVPIVATRFALNPLGSIEGARVFLATTAPRWTHERLRTQIDALGATCVAVSHALSDRDALRADLDAVGREADLLVTEIKAAGIDVAAHHAESYGWRVVLCDNVPIPTDDPEGLDRVFDALR